MAETAAAAQLAVAAPARMRPQMYAMALTTMIHQGSVTLIFASEAAAGSSTIFWICSFVSLIFMTIVFVFYGCKGRQKNRQNRKAFHLFL